MLAREIGTYLHEQDVVVYDEATPGVSTCFVAALPDQPDQLVALFPTSGVNLGGKLGYDNEGLQVRTRGVPHDGVGPFDKARAVYNVLHKLRNVTLSTGLYIVQAIAQGPTPQWIGSDEAGREEYTHNYLIEHRAITAHRV